MLRSKLRPTGLLSLAWCAAAAALALMPSHAFAVAGQHTTLASFKGSTRADVLLDPLTGPDGDPIPTIMVSGGGYSYTIDATNSGIARASGFVSPSSNFSSLRLTFTGKPVTAFAATIVNQDGTLSSVGGEIVAATNTGEQFILTLPAGPGTFFGFTTTTPFTVVTLNNTADNILRYEAIDDVYVGTSVTAAIAADQCADAPTVSPITAVQYPFTTVGATAATIAGSCGGVSDSGPDVWFRFLAPVYANVTITTCGCDFDSILRVFDKCGAGAVQIVCNDDFCADTYSGGSNRASRVLFRSEAGEDYLVRISGFASSIPAAPNGSGNLTFSVVPDCPGDFDHSGVVSIDDLFKFINAWLGTCP